MIEIGLGHYLTLGAIIFFLGVLGIFLNRKKCNCNFNVNRANLISSKY